MKTDVLIEQLAERLEPISPWAARRNLVGLTVCGVAVAAVAILSWRGFRPDLMTAMAGAMFWTKFAYTLAIGVLALWAAERLGRPGANPTRPMALLVRLLIVFALAAVVRFVMAQPGERHQILMGHSAMICPWIILGLSLPVLASAIVGLRGLAPTRPTLAGFAAGVSAGGFAAFAYAFSCNESGMPFVAVWYTMPVLLAGGLGAVAGRFALRW